MRRQQALALPGHKPVFPDHLGLAEQSDLANPVAAIGRYNAKRMAAAASREPLDYRAGHPALAEKSGPVVERVARSLPDSSGAIGTPNRSYDTLGTLLRNGTIRLEEHDAGRCFEEDFFMARLDPLHASNPARVRTQGAESLTDAMIAGRRRVQSTLKMLGGISAPAGSAIWQILGSGQTVKEWAASCQFGQSGRSLDEKVAKGIFLAALGLLAVHYGKVKR